MSKSKIISTIFHPINFPVIGSLLYFILLPKYLYIEQEKLFLIVILIGAYLFPLVLVFLLKQFKMINTYHMETIEERKFPMVLFISLTLIIGNWLFKSGAVVLLSLFFLGYTLGLVTAYLFLHAKIKLSLHTAAISGLITFLTIFSFYYKINLIVLIIVFILIAGIVASARLQLKAHKANEIYLGFFLGIITQIIPFIIYIM